MGEMILRKPAILYETIEAIYQRVNGITFSQKKRDILLKYGQKLSGPERNRIELLCSHLSGLVEEVCGELPESPQLTYYFQRWDTESKWQNMCLAKLMIYSFLDIRIADFQDGVSIAIQPLLGFNYGAHLFERVKKTLWYGIFGATGIGLALWALVHLFPEQIVGFFGITNESLRDFTVFALKVQLLMLPFIGFQIVGSNYFQATGQPLKSIFLSLTRQILFLVPLLIVLPMVLPSWFPQFVSLDALYFATPAADFLAIFTTVVFIVLEMGRLKKLESGELKAKF